MFFRILLSILFCLVFSEGKILRKCESNEFPCSDGGCVDKSKWCDSVEDCADDSDEHFCFRSSSLNRNPNRCKDEFFICHDGPCIPRIGRCDGYTSCTDHSDENNCTLPITVFEEMTSANMTTPVKPYTTQNPRMTEESTLKNVTQVEFHVRPANHEMQSDSFAPAIAVASNVKDVDIMKGFVEVDTHYFSHEKLSAESWLMSIRDEEYGWVDEEARAVTAMYLSDPDLIKKKSESMLMTKQLHLKLSLTLTRNQTKPIPLTELASYINALHATCSNPKNFHGHDLVEVLRQRTNIAQESGKFVNPSVYLTLCISNATLFSDIRKIQDMTYSVHRVEKLDMQALLTLAASCITRIPMYVNTRLEEQIATRMFKKVADLGLPGNVYELSLVIQALNEAKVNHDLWNRSDALHKLCSLQQQNGTFGDILATYYALPVLAGKSIISLANHCNQEKEGDMIPVEVLMNGKEQKDFVSYSLYFGKPVDVSQSLRVRVRKSANLLDVMRIAAATNPIYSFKFDMSRGKPFVYSIGGIVNDAEQGLYWTLYTSRRNSSEVENTQPFNEDIRSFYPTAADHIVYWYKKLY